MKISKSSFLALTALTAVIAAPMQANAADYADTIVIMDESGSMAGEQTWIKDMIVDLEAALQSAGVGTGSQANRYGLVGFGSFSSSTVLGRSLLVGGGLYGNATDFVTAADNLVTDGFLEDGYAGLDFTLKNYASRPGAATNFILITDEDRDNENFSLTFTSTLAALKGRNVLLNAVLDNPFYVGSVSGPRALGIDHQGTAYLADGMGGYTTSSGGVVGDGDGSTETDYVPLALATNAAAWDLNLLRSGNPTANSFTKAFVDIKVKEIVTDPGDTAKVPEPASIAGLGALGLFGLGAKLKRNFKKETEA